MTTTPSSWFINQTKKGGSAPSRRFYIGTSDYSERVTKWPVVKRSVNQLKSTSINIPLANDDGELNGFYLNTYSMPNTIQMRLGYEVASGCIGHWAFDSGSGTVAIDSSSHGNDGTLEGTMNNSDWVTGVVEYALDFDGVDDRVICGNSSPLDSVGSGDFSVSFWMKSADAVPISFSSMFAKYDNASNWMSIRSFGSNNQLSVQFLKDATGGSLVFADLGPFDTTWHHIVLTIDRSNDLMKCFMDTIQSSNQVVISYMPMDCSNSGDVSWGAIHWGGTPYEGSLDDCRVFNRALTNDDILGLYNDPHAPTYAEYIDIFTGNLKQVNYGNQKCTIKANDSIWDLTQIKVGDSENPVTFSAQIPTDIAWTLCTCYGLMSNIESTSNPDINYQSFLDWSSVMSADSIVNEARYEGVKIIDALNRLAKMNDSVIWTDGAGKINFRRLNEVSSLDLLITRDERTGLEINIDDNACINKQWVGWAYDSTSKYWSQTVYGVNSESIDAFGLHENYLKDETIWFTNSASSINRVEREVQLKSEPPKTFDIATGLMGLEHGLTETVRMVEPFYSISSDSGWRIMEQNIYMDTGKVSLQLNGATTLDAFYLDVSSLDGDEYLL